MFAAAVYRRNRNHATSEKRPAVAASGKSEKRVARVRDDADLRSGWPDGTRKRRQTYRSRSANTTLTLI